MEEGWVQCDDCQGWVHQICGLFNKGNNKDDADFHCPACLEEGLQTGRRDQVSLPSPPLLACGSLLPLVRCEIHPTLLVLIGQSSAFSNGLHLSQVE